jgi:hypothetical protein
VGLWPVQCNPSSSAKGERSVISRLGTAFVVGLFVVGSVATVWAEDWQQLGQQYVDYRTNPVAIQAKADGPAVSRIKLQVKERSLEIQDVKVFLAGGESFGVTLNSYLGPGRETRDIEVPAGPKAIEKVEFTYRSGSTGRRLALVRLLGAS